MHIIAAAPGTQLLQREVAAGVLADLPEGDLVVVGHSFGGQVALEVALLAPVRVRRLVIVCSRHTPYPAFAQGAKAVLDGIPVDLDASLRRWFTGAELAADPPVVSYLRRQLAVVPRKPWAASLMAIAGYDRSSTLGYADVPTALFGAGQDVVSPPAAMTALADALPDATLQIVEEWAHMSPFAQPAAFAARLTAAVDHPAGRRGAR
jgi:pimeloyl-ACP methyl ester carboxylesterase